MPQQLKSPLYIKHQDFSFQIQDETWTWQGLGKSYSNYLNLNCYDNVATALAAISLLH
jgi:hypothetical protein